jgi:hypothetical protein
MHIAKYANALPEDANAEKGSLRSVLAKLGDVWVNCGNGVYGGKCGNCLATYEMVLDTCENLGYLKSSYSGDSKLYEIVEKGE